MARSIGSIILGIRGDSKGLDKDFARLKKKVKRTFRDIGKIAAGNMLAQFSTRAIGGLKNSVKEAFRFAGAIEQSTIAFETLLGSMAAAEKRMGGILDFAKRTPFQLEELTRASQMLEAMTQGALAGVEGLGLVGDTAAALGKDIETVARNIGKLYSGLQSGTPVGEATQQLMELGIITGGLKRELDALAAQEIIGGEAWTVAEKHFLKFAGAMEQQSTTLNGLLSTLSDTWSQLLGESVKDSMTDAKDAIEALIDLLGDPKTMETVQAFVGGFARLAQSAGWVAGKFKSLAESLGTLAGGAYYGDEAAIDEVLFGVKTMRQKDFGRKEKPPAGLAAQDPVKEASETLAGFRAENEKTTESLPEKWGDLGWSKAMAEFREENEKTTESLTEKWGEVGWSVDGAIGQMSSALAKGELSLESFGKIVANAIQEIMAHFIKMAAIKAIMGGIAGLSPGGGGGGGLENAVDAGPGFTAGTIGMAAQGGPLTVGRPTLVGEEGPELIVPRSAGTVIPNDRLGGGASVSINFEAGVTRRELAALMPELTKKVKAAVAADYGRGGGYRRRLSG